MALFAQDDWRITPSLSIQGGGRAIVDSAFGNALTPNLGVRFAPAQGWNLRLGMGTGFRAPDAKERFLRFENASVGYVITGTPDLAPERSTGLQASVVWRRHVTGHDQARVAAGLDGHVSWVRGLVTTQSQGLQGTRTIYAYANVDEARTLGSVAWLRWRPHRRLRTQLAWTWLQALDLSRDRPLQGRAPHSVTGTVRLSLPWTGTRLMLRAAWWQARPRYEDRDGDSVDEVYASPAYTMIDARLEQPLGERFVLHIGLDNALGAGAEPDLLLKPRLWLAGIRGRI